MTTVTEDRAAMLGSVIDALDSLTGWPTLASIWFDLGVVVLGPTCPIADCRAVAAHDVRWPGQGGSPRCDAHRAWAAKVAATLGFELWSTPLPVREVPPPDDAVARFAAVELD